METLFRGFHKADLILTKILVSFIRLPSRGNGSVEIIEPSGRQINKLTNTSVRLIHFRYPDLNRSGFEEKEKSQLFPVNSLCISCKGYR